MKKLVFKWTVEEEVMVVVSGDGVMTEDLWARHMDDLQNKPVSRVLGFNIGTVSVTSVQRKQASDIAKQRGTFSIIVSDSAMTRGIITAVSWLGANIKAFPWSEKDRAYSALDLEPEAESSVRKRAEALLKECEAEIKAQGK